MGTDEDSSLEDVSSSSCDLDLIRMDEGLHCCCCWCCCPLLPLLLELTDPKLTLLSLLLPLCAQAGQNTSSLLLCDVPDSPGVAGLLLA